MRWITSWVFAFGALVVLIPLQAAMAGPDGVPGWVKPALAYAVDAGYIDASSFEPNVTMARSAFGEIVRKAFGSKYSRTEGMVTAAELDRALVRGLHKGKVAKRLRTAVSPGGWSPAPGPDFGVGVVAREMGLRRNRSTSEEIYEASPRDPITQADILWSIWKAKTAPSLHGADALAEFRLPEYTAAQRDVVKFAMSLAGTPYVYGGESVTKTAPGYPYGAQQHGGFDCSGFAWYVLRAATPQWVPSARPYGGWSLPERSSAQMAKATKDRLTYSELAPGDLVFFAPGGAQADPADVYHAGIYLGNGWMIHSSASRAGVSISNIGPGSWWKDQMAWGRRIMVDPPPT